MPQTLLFFPFSFSPSLFPFPFALPPFSLILLSLQSFSLPCFLVSLSFQCYIIKLDLFLKADVLVHFYIAVLPPTVTHKLLRWRNTVHNHTLRTALPLSALCRWGMTSVIQGANQAFMMKPRQRAAAEVRVTQWCHACGFIIPAAPRCWLIDCKTAATCIYRFGIKTSSILLNTKWFDVEESSLLWTGPPLIEVTVTWLTTFSLIGKINRCRVNDGCLLSQSTAQRCTADCETVKLKYATALLSTNRFHSFSKRLSSGGSTGSSIRHKNTARGVNIQCSASRCSISQINGSGACPDV